MFQSKRSIAPSFFWLASSAGMVYLSQLLSPEKEPFTGGHLYVIFTLIYVTAVALCWKKLNQVHAKLHFLPFVVGVCAIAFFSLPFLENDHHRYLWEGKVLASGENPYNSSPSDPGLAHIEFADKDKIYADDLTSIYPPLGLAIFGMVAPFEAKVGLRILMLLNAVLVWVLFVWLARRQVPAAYLALLFPFFQKEFIQAIHIDLFAFIPALMAVHYFYDRGYFKPLIFLATSIWIKVIALLILPLYLFENFKKYKYQSGFYITAIVAGVSLPCFFLFAYLSGVDFSGVQSFSEYWYWNPGFYELLRVTTGNLGPEMRIVSGACYLVFLGVVCLRHLLLFNSHYKHESIYELLYFCYGGLMFFTPVFNAWYAVWFVVFAMMSRNLPGVLYATFSCFGYLYYGHDHLYYLQVICTHIWFPLSLIYPLFVSFRPQMAKSVL